jgi:HEPN domain-containing protein
MVNPRRIGALMEMADEDLAGAKALLTISTRLARYHVQQSAEKAVKALLELRGLNPGREHRFEALAEMLPQGDPWRGRIQAFDLLSPAATSLRYPTVEGRIMPPPARELVEREIDTVAAFIQDVRSAVRKSSD